MQTVSLVTGFSDSKRISDCSHDSAIYSLEAPRDENCTLPPLPGLIAMATWISIRSSTGMVQIKLEKKILRMEVTSIPRKKKCER